MSSGPAFPSDQAARVRAATDFTTNLVVTSGAGTGKTSLLVERLLNAVGSGRAPLGAIAAITFTDKAAGELRERIAAGLEELRAMSRGERVGSPESPATRSHRHLAAMSIPAGLVAERALQALGDLDRAAITTIHGLCSEILRTHPLESGLPPGFAVDRGTAFLPLVDEAWERFLEDELGPRGDRQELWSRILETISLGDARAIARELAHGKIGGDLLARPYHTADRVAALAPEARTLSGRLSCMLAGVENLTRAPSEFVAQAREALLALAEGRLQDSEDVITASKRLAAGTLPEFESKHVSAEEAAPLVAASKRALALLRVIRDADDTTAAAVYEVLAPLARSLRDALARRGLVDFDGLLVKTRDLLRDRPESRRVIRRRFRLLLVDEFQDTDPIQYEIALFLAEEDLGAARDSFAARLAPGRLFIVGDSKQSIYRFRGADFAAYRRAVDRVLDCGGASLALTANFRSEASIVEAVNTLFSAPNTAWRPSPTLPEYEPITASRPRGLGPTVELWTVASSGRGLASDRRRAEGLAIAGEISRFAGPGGSCRFGDILVLLRGFSEVAIYLRAFREAAIPFVVSGGRTFRERTEIMQAMEVLRAVADPGDAIALLAFLRSPAGAVPDAELRTHAESGGLWTVDSVADERTCPMLAQALARLRRLRDDADGRTVDEAIRRVLHLAGLWVFGGLAFEGAQRVANLEKLARAAADVARDGRRDLLETLDALDKILEAEPEGDSPLSDESADTVRVMTIHKAKGLEAPVVVLADLAAGRNAGGGATPWEVEVVRSTRGEELAIGGPRLKNGAALLREFEDGEHETGEDLRLLYVALTRARDRLIVLGGPPTSRSPWIDALTVWGYDPENPPAHGADLAGGLVLHRHLDPAEIRPGSSSEPPPGDPGSVTAYESAVARADAEAAPPFASPSAWEDRARDFPEDDAFARERLDPSLARAVGIAVHARLERFDGDVAALIGDLDREAKSLLESFAASPLAARLRTLDVLGREIPLLFDEDARRRWRGTIDLLYRDGDGAIVVADYKTDAALEGANERHREQLRVYAEALRTAIPGARVRAELWMLRHGAIVPVNV